MKNNENWWKETFSETYYSLWNHEESSSPNIKKRKNEGLDFLTLLNLKKGSNLLDLACGPGRHSINLAQKGFKVTGVDYSSAALKIAKKLTKVNDVSVTFLKKDIRLLDLKQKFEAVFLLGNSFGYFIDKDNKKVIKNIAKHLKKDGYFIIHTLNPLQVISEDEKNKISEHKILGGKLKMKLISFDPNTFVRKSVWEITKDGEKKNMDVILRLYTVPEIKRMLLEEGLEIKKVFGSLDLSPYVTDSPSLIILAKKK